jgi:hypothetical protein
MRDVIIDFEERARQIEKYLSFVWIMDNYSSLTNLDGISEKKIIIDDSLTIEMKRYLNINNEFIIESHLTRILKSNTILLLYNQIEGTVSSVLNEFFSAINRETENYKKFNLPIKKIWLRYKHRSFSTGEKRSDDYILQAIENILEEVIDISPKTIKDSELGERIIYNYDAYSSETKTNEVAGNLDARKIKEVFNLYGLPSLDIRCDSMLKVKNKRNSLAHGNETFVQVGSNYTIEDLFKMNVEISSFLKRLLTETEDYIVNKRYIDAVA